MEMSGKNVLIIGKGISGEGARDAATALGAQAVITETADVPPEAEKADLIVVSPSVKPCHPIFAYAVLHGKPLVGEIGLGAMINTKPVIGVTGTNGKTTVVEMLGAVYREAGIKAAVCGNIGISFSRTAVHGNYDCVILELSSFQLLNAAPLHCHIACITNIDEDHIDYHGSFFEYKRAKLAICARQTSRDFFIKRSTDDYFIKTDAAVADAHAVDYEIKARGLHNKLNAGFAAAVARLDGISEGVIRRALENFEPSSYRIALSAEINGTKFFNDSKGTNISATIAAARTVSGSSALIVGGSDKGGSFEKLFDGLPENITCVFVIGQTADRIMCAARLRGFSRTVKCSGLADAVCKAANGGFSNVLFSPACASFDEYRNYAERGEAFDSIVKGLIN